MERRNFFLKIFGKKTGPPGESRFELISSTTGSFTPWDNNIYGNDIVRSCIRPTAEAVGKLNAKHIRGMGEGMRVDAAPWIKKILANPNPYMSMQDMLMKLATHREISHNAMAFLKRDDYGYPEAVYPMPYSSAELMNYQGEMYVKFRFPTGKTVTVPYKDVIHIRKDFNTDDIFGDSGVSALTNIMSVITTTDQGIVNAVKNSAVLKWIMKFKQVLQPKDVEVQVKEFTEKYLAITNTGGAAAADPRYDLEQVRNENYVPNAVLVDKAIQRLYAYFGVNNAIAQNNYSEDQANAFYESKIEPIAIQLSNAFTRAFFSEREQSFGNRIVFDASNLAYASMQTKLGLVQMVDRGAMTPNEWRSVMNLAPIDGGDKPIRRLDTQTVDVVEKPKTEGDEGNG